MTVKELKELLNDVPDDYEVRYEETSYNIGAQCMASHETTARVLIVSKAAHCVLLAESE